MTFGDFDKGFEGESVADEGAPFDAGGEELTGPPRSLDFEIYRTLATVLVVDDDATKLAMLTKLVRKILGERIGIIALSQLDDVSGAIRNGVDAVLTDFELDEFTGRDVAELAIGRGVPASHILVATGNPEHAREVVPEGVEVFATPHQLEELKVALNGLGRRLLGFIGEA
mgnify:CR=1 FL=1